MISTFSNKALARLWGFYRRTGELTTKVPFFVYLIRKNNLYEAVFSDLQKQTFGFKPDFHLHVALSFAVSWVVVNKGQMHINVKVQ